MSIYDVFSGGNKPYDKEQWAAQKQAERKEAYELIDNTCSEMAVNGDSFRQYLDVQGRFDRYSVANAVLVSAQMPEATQLKDYGKWKQSRVYVNKDAQKITILEPSKEYLRDDGTKAVSYNAKAVYDISETSAKDSLILALCGIVPVVWFALLTAPFVSGGLVEIVRSLPQAMNNPFSVTVCEDSLKTVLIFLLAYGMGIGIYLSTRRNYRRREEHGSAKWGDAGAVNKKYRDKDLSANKLLTQNVRIGLDGKKHRRNLNILVCGGSGAGKTRFFCKPNAMQCNTSMVILDPKGEIVRDVGGLLEKKGYEVRVLDLINIRLHFCRRL